MSLGEVALRSRALSSPRRRTTSLARGWARTGGAARHARADAPDAAATKVFEGALPERASSPREELRWVADALGDVRDLDVQIEALPGLAGRGRRGGLRVPGEDPDHHPTKLRAEPPGKHAGDPGLRPARASLVFIRGDATPRVSCRAGAAQTNGKDRAGEPVTAAAPALISDRHRKWRKAAKRLDQTSSPEAFHDVPKGKRSRYTLEFFSDVNGRPVQTSC